MSQGARSSCSAFSAVGKLEEDEAVLHVFDDRRRTKVRYCFLHQGSEEGYVWADLCVKGSVYSLYQSVPSFDASSW